MNGHFAPKRSLTHFGFFLCLFDITSFLSLSENKLSPNGKKWPKDRIGSQMNPYACAVSCRIAGTVRWNEMSAPAASPAIFLEETLDCFLMKH